MSIWIVWLAPVAMLLMLSAQPVMRTLSVALGSCDGCPCATTPAITPRVRSAVAIVVVNSFFMPGVLSLVIVPVASLPSAFCRLSLAPATAATTGAAAALPP